MAKIAFLGLGQMGAPMARRLLQVGHQLTVWDRTADHAKPLATEGAAVAASPAQAGRAAEFAITMLATPDALREVVLGENGLAKALGESQVYIDMSTVGPDTVRSIAAKLPKGVVVVDAPVRGSVGAAVVNILRRGGKARVTSGGATDALSENRKPRLARSWHDHGGSPTSR
jgi:3-hydroxyisobutyrate dehydrogenase-like beta-hydroxyacid dehydrogenase